MGDADASLREDANLFRREPHAVRGDDVVREKSDRIEVEAGQQSVLPLRDLPQFIARFGDVNQNRRVQLVGESARLLQMLARDEIWRVRRERGRDQRIAMPLLDEVANV